MALRARQWAKPSHPHAPNRRTSQLWETVVEEVVRWVTQKPLKLDNMRGFEYLKLNHRHLQGVERFRRMGYFRRSPRSTLPTAELPEPLSERELEALMLIEAGKSNRRIAQELFVTEGTVKTHIRNIYRKLEAHSRTQALVRARELNVL